MLSWYVEQSNKMNCLSRSDRDKNIFLEQNNFKRRWNIFPLIGIENGSIVCANETYPLEDICYLDEHTESRPCTLLGTNEIVDLAIYNKF